MDNIHPSYWVVAPRRNGKTTAALRWFMQGKPVDQHPGWSRIFVVSDSSMIRYTRSLLSDLWEGQGREGRPPFDAILTAAQVFSPSYIRERTSSFYERWHAFDDMDRVKANHRQNYLYDEVFSIIRVGVFTQDGITSPGEITPSQFIAMLNVTSTEETP